MSLRYKDKEEAAIPSYAVKDVIDKTEDRHAEVVKVKRNGEPLPKPYTI